MRRSDGFARALLAVFLACGAAVALATERPLYGVATHFGMRGQTLAAMPMLAASGASSLRDEVFWSEIEDVDGQLTMPARFDAYVDAALALGVQPLLVLDYGHPAYDGGGKPLSAQARAGFERYARFVVKHFRGRVQRFELWNEWDIAIGGTEPGSADAFVTLVRQVAPALRAVNQRVEIIAGASTPEGAESGWLRRAVELGLLDSVDGLAIHSYNYRRRGHATPEDWAAGLTRLQTELAAWRPHTEPQQAPPLYVTEMGWPDHWWRHGVSSELQAAYAARAYLLASALAGVRGVWWYTLADQDGSPFDAENYFGLIDTQGQPKPSWHALAQLLPILRVARRPLLTDELAPPWRVWRSELDDGRKLVAMWRADDSDGELHARR